MTKRKTATDRKPPPAPAVLDNAPEEAPKYEIKIDLDRSKLTWGDIMLLGSMEGNENRQMDGNELIKMGKLFNHVIVGGVEDLPLDATPDILRALNSALKADADAKN